MLLIMSHAPAILLALLSWSHAVRKESKPLYSSWDFQFKIGERAETASKRLIWRHIAASKLFRLLLCGDYAEERANQDIK